MPAPPHRSRVLASPWPGVHATDSDSARHYGRHWHTTCAFGVFSLAELVALAGIGKFQLLRRFRKMYGATPHDWLLQRRANRARGLIRQGAGLCEAAASSGFADQSHMTRVFMQRFGFTHGTRIEQGPRRMRIIGAFTEARPSPPMPKDEFVLKFVQP